MPQTDISFCLPGILRESIRQPPGDHSSILIDWLVLQFVFSFLWCQSSPKVVSVESIAISSLLTLRQTSAILRVKISIAGI